MAGTELNGIGIDIENKSFEVSASSSQSDSWSLGCDITIEDMDADIQEIRVNDITMSGNITTEEISVDIESTEVKAMDLAVGFVFGSLGSSLGGNVVDGLDDIKDSIADINDAIQDISKESANIKVTINGIQSQVNDIGTELTNKASVETVVEIGEQITEVQTNVAEQTIKVNSLGAEIATKASADSVTQIADELAITNESLAEQVIKVTDLTAEVSTKASSEMVTEISDNLKITNDTLAEQTLKVDALSAEISTKASTESVTQIGKDLTLVNETVAEQTIKVSDLESEIATKASSESVLTLEGDVTAVEKAVAEQTIKVEGLEASIESKVSKEEFNEKTGELDTKYTNLKQTADNLTIEVGEQGESLTKVVADVNGLSVRVDDIGEAQVNYDNTLSELTDILTPEQMSTQVGKGVVLSTVIATRDTDGNITAGMNASSVHSDPVHGRVVFAGGVKNKTDWTKATGILYEDGHIVMNSGEFGENVKIGNAMFRAVLEGDFDLFSYPENGTLVPLFQVNKDSSGKIVSISTPYDFTVNRNLVVFGDTSSGGEGGSSSVGIQGIKLNGTTYRDDNSDGIIDLGTIGGGTLTEITYEMIVEALGYTPANSASLGSLAYKNGLTASEVGALSTSGGTITSDSYFPLAIKRNLNAGVVISFENSRGYLGSIGVHDNGAIFSDSTTTYTLLHSGNYASYALPLGGGTLTGNLRIGDNDNTAFRYLMLVRSGHAVRINNLDTGAYFSFGAVDTSGGFTIEKVLLLGDDGLRYSANGGSTYNDILTSAGGTISGTTNGPLNINTSNASEIGLSLSINSSRKAWFGYNTALGTTQGAAYMYNAVAKKYMGILDDGSAFLGGNTILHSGNVGDYALKTYGTDMPSNIVNYVGFGKTAHSWKTTGAALSFGIDSYYAQIQVDYESGDIFTRNYNAGTFGAWKTIAFTDSTVASAYKLVTSAGANAITVDSNGSATIQGHLFNSAASTYYLGTSASAWAAVFTNIVRAESGKNLLLGANATNHIIINSSGNVTIGDSDLAATISKCKLYVDGRVHSSRAYLFNGEYGIWRAEQFTGNIPDTGMVYNATTHAFVGGNVLIGTTTDSGYKLDVNGTGRFTGAVTMASNLKVDSYIDITGTSRLRGNVTMDGDVHMGNNKGFYFKNSAGSGALSLFLSSSNVLGIAYSNIASVNIGVATTIEGALTVGAGATINGNLVVAGDISA